MLQKTLFNLRDFILAQRMKVIPRVFVFLQKFSPHPELNPYCLLFLESGLWDGFLLKLFDRLLSLSLLHTLAPLSSLSIGENGGKSVWSLISRNLNSSLFNSISVSSLLVTLSRGLLITLFGCLVVFLFV